MACKNVAQVTSPLSRSTCTLCMNTLAVFMYIQVPAWLMKEQLKPRGRTTYVHECVLLLGSEVIKHVITRIYMNYMVAKPMGSASLGAATAE